MRFIIIHGSYGNAKENWFPWLKKELEKLGHEVIIPTFPTPEGQSLTNWLKTFQPYLKKIDEETVFIGHSMGCSFILNVLEKIDIKVKSAFLIAGFTGKLDDPKFDELNKTFAEKKLNWEKIRKNCAEFFVINAKDDPYVPVSKGEEIAKKLNVKPIIYEKGGHFNKTAGYTDFKDLLKMINEIGREKLFIKNRKGQKVSVIVDISKNPKGLAFVMHGLGGYKEQQHIEAFAQAFKDNHFTVVRFDTTNTIGESDGRYEDATITNYYEDLEDVIKWSESQKWYQEPFWLAGHSTGGMCITLYAEKYPKKVKGLAPISTDISGELYLKIMKKEVLDNWKKTGYKISKSNSKPGVIKKLKWSFLDNFKKYNLLLRANTLTMPVLLIVGENDESDPLEHQKLLFDRIPGKKELHLIKDAPHTFRQRKHLDEIKKIMDKWIKKII